ncbi:hypothetical protein EYZ11_002108 [Aspergillus tanneri]|uniref:Extracellular membrane protein CFEM domain-containing protein n=1 Tax=Aspergillus tanneri TaxID=1220188 RepID=A0A4S3JRH9_9EURO|nr:hypothetical protein EYZ11_002108 [Aspergillus tanneri]
MKLATIAVSLAALVSATPAARKTPKCFDECFGTVGICTKENGPGCFRKN